MRWLLLTLLLLVSVRLNAMERAYGDCSSGGVQVNIPAAGLSTTNAGAATYWQQSFPACTVTVYLAGITNLSITSISRTSNVVTATLSGSFPSYGVNSQVTVSGNSAGFNGSFTVLSVISPNQVTWNQTGSNTSSSGGTASFQAAIYSDNLLTPLGNPLTSDNTGHWFFYAVNGRYDVARSGIATLGDVLLYDPGTVSGGVVNCYNPSVGDAGAQIQACINALPSSGGIADATGITGTQSAALVVNVNKPVLIKLGQVSLTCTQSCFNITANFVHIQGSASNLTQIIQAAAGTTGSPLNLIYNTGTITDFEADHIGFIGFAGTTFTGGNDGVNLITCTRCSVHDNNFTGLQHDAVWAQNSTDVTVSNNQIYSISDGLRFTGVVRGTIDKNTIRNRQVTDTTFTIAIIQDSVAGTTYQNSSDTHITNNKIISYHNSQAIIVHDGVGGTISNNVIDDVGAGIAISAFATPDATSDWTIEQNEIRLTSTSASQTVAYGITCNGNNTGALSCNHVTITGNKIFNANASLKNDLQGGILLTFSDDTSVVGNLINNAYGHGIALNASVTRTSIYSNQIVDTQPSSGLYQDGIETAPNTVTTGYIGQNTFNNMLSGVRLDGYSPSLVVAPQNCFSNVNVCVTFPTAATTDQQLSPQRFGIGIAPLYALDVAKAYVSGTVAAPSSISGSTSTASGSLPSGSYIIATTAQNDFGQTTRSPESTQTLGGTGQVIINPPTQTGDSTCWNAYMTNTGGASGTETQQNTNCLNYGSAYVAKTYISGTALPVLNGTGGPQFGDRTVLTLSPSATDSTTSYATDKVALTNGGNAQNFTGIIGATDFEVDHEGSGTVSSLDSTDANVNNISSGTVTLAQGFTSSLRNSSTGAITTGIDYHALVVTAQSATAISLGSTHGTGYNTGDRVSIGSCGAVASVTASGGVVSAVTLVSGGSACTVATNQSTTAITGSGTGLTITISTISSVLGTHYAFKSEDSSANTTTNYSFYGVGSSPAFFGGPATINAGTNIIYRCLTAGTLRAGQLTSVSADCGTSTDTGLRTP